MILSLLAFKTLAICIETGILMFYRKSSKHCKQWKQLNLLQILKIFCEKNLLYNDYQRHFMSSFING